MRAETRHLSLPRANDLRLMRQAAFVSMMARVGQAVVNWPCDGMAHTNRRYDQRSIVELDIRRTCILLTAAPSSVTTPSPKSGLPSNSPEHGGQDHGNEPGV